jgi:hypothetical protein
MKKTARPGRPATHFEQIPVAVVKKVAVVAKAPVTAKVGRRGKGPKK